MRPFHVHLTQLWSDGSVLATTKLLFSVEGEGITNVEHWEIPIHKAGTTGALEFRRHPHGSAIWTSRQFTPVKVIAGDTLHYGLGHAKFSLASGGSTAAIFGYGPTEYVDIEAFMQENPDATPRDIWEAAFVAGHQTAYTLLTGEAQ